MKKVFVFIIMFAVFNVFLLEADDHFFFDDIPDDAIFLDGFQLGLPVFETERGYHSCSFFGYDSGFNRMLSEGNSKLARQSRASGIVAGTSSVLMILFSWYALPYPGIFYTLTEKRTMEAVAAYNGGMLYMKQWLDLEPPENPVRMEVRSGLPRFFLGKETYRCRLYGYSEKFALQIVNDSNRNEVVQMRRASKRAGGLMLAGLFMLQGIWILPLSLEFGGYAFAEQGLISLYMPMSAGFLTLGAGLMGGGGYWYTRAESYAMQAVGRYNAGRIPYRNGG